MSTTASILTSAASVFGPLALAFAVIRLSALRRRRKLEARRPIGPLGNPIRDLRL